MAGAVHQCSLMDADGKMCGQTLFILCSFRQHMRHAKRGQHGQPSLHPAVARAQCPSCLSHFSSLHVSADHLRRASLKGFCMPDLPLVYSLENVEPEHSDNTYTCIVCHEEFHNITMHYAHALEHFGGCVESEVCTMPQILSRSPQLQPTCLFC